VWQTDGHTDERTDILPRHSPRYVYASRGKIVNDWTFESKVIKFGLEAPRGQCPAVTGSNPLTLLGTPVIVFITARRVCIARTMLSQDICSFVCPSVRLSVCHTPVFCRHRWTYIITFLPSGRPAILHRVRKKGTDSSLAVTSTNLGNFFLQFLAQIILTVGPLRLSYYISTTMSDIPSVTSREW